MSDASRRVFIQGAEHAHQMDYGAAAAKYIDAFFNNINWDVVAQRV